MATSPIAAIARSNIKAKPAEGFRDPIAALLAPNSRITAVQRALTEFGYGPLATSGVYDAGTRAAIERFEATLSKTPERIALREIGETFVLPL